VTVGVSSTVPQDSVFTVELASYSDVSLSLRSYAYIIIYLLFIAVVPTNQSINQFISNLQQLLG